MLRSPHASGHGWCEQADRISLTSDGRFRLEGRIDRVLKVEGKRVSLERLEREIARLPWVSEAAVVALSEPRTYLGAVVKLSAAGVAEIERVGKFRFERMLRRELQRLRISRYCRGGGDSSTSCRWMDWANVGCLM